MLHLRQCGAVLVGLASSAAAELGMPRSRCRPLVVTPGWVMHLHPVSGLLLLVLLSPPFLSLGLGFS